MARAVSTEVPPPESTGVLRDVESRLGIVPNFFRLGADCPDITASLWGFAKFSYLDNPLPSLFKERLFVFLSRFSDVRYCIARHIGFLVGLGHLSGDRGCPPATVEQVLRLISLPLPHGEELEPCLALLERHEAPPPVLPDPETREEEAIFACAAHVLLTTPQASRCLEALRGTFDSGTFQHFLLFLAFIRTAHFWSRVHPELKLEDDVTELLVHHEALAAGALNGSDAIESGLAEALRNELTALRSEKQKTDQRASLLSARTAEALTRSEARLRQVFESNVVGMIRWDLERSLILDANAEFLRMTGYAREDVAGGHLNFRSLTPPEFTPRNEEGIRALRTQGYAPPYEKEYFRKDGTRLPLIIAGTRFNDSPSEGISFLIDISEAKRAEERLRTSEIRYRRLFEAAKDGIVLIDPETRKIVDANPFITRLLGCPREELIGREWFEIGRAEDETANRAIFESLKQEGDQVRFDDRPLQGMSGQTHEVEVVANVYVEAHRAVLQCNIRDIAERKQAEAALREAKEAAETANRSKDLFLAVLSHELRAPLNPVLMTVEELESDLSLPDAVREDMAMIKRNINLEATLIDDLLDVSRIVSGKLSLAPAPMDLNEAVVQACASCGAQAAERRVRLQTSLGHGAGHIDADPARFQQILGNVLRNAVKFSPEGGIVAVSTARLSPERVEVRVRDNGLGIPAEALSTIFEAFEQCSSSVTRQFGGLGLGLAICKSLVEAHSGSIRAESGGRGCGATFVIEFPSVTLRS